MLVRYADWIRPTDAAFAFRLRDVAPRRPAPGTLTDVRRVIENALGAGESTRFEAKIRRWSGPDDVTATGTHPYAAEQLAILESGPRDRLTPDDVERVLTGCILAIRAPHQTDYVLRDHHMLDVVLYEWVTSGRLPNALFHADRHSDWCTDAVLDARVPDQAATWWMLLRGLKRPGTGAPVLDERDVIFATDRPPIDPWMSGRDILDSTRTPSFLASGESTWRHALDRTAGVNVDWVSLDLDGFQPSPQLRLTRDLLRDARFGAMMATAKVRVFVLSPQFTNGGDKVPWEVNGSRASSLRLLNLLRKVRAP